MNQDGTDPAKLDAFCRLQDSLNGKNPTVRDFIELARAAREAGLPKEARYNILKAGELEPENPLVTAGL